MAGNLFDFVEDDWHDNYEGAPTDGSAWIDEPRADRRVRRGGDFHNHPHTLRVSARYRPYPTYRYDYIGFRCCVDDE